jgi:hypothetical protein
MYLRSCPSGSRISVQLLGDEYSICSQIGVDCFWVFHKATGLTVA